MDVGSNTRIFANITMLPYIRPLKCNVQIQNVRKATEKGFVMS